jgi:hypothetical protein
MRSTWASAFASPSSRAISNALAGQELQRTACESENSSEASDTTVTRPAPDQISKRSRPVRSPPEGNVSTR